MQIREEWKEFHRITEQKIKKLIVENTNELNRNNLKCP
jgi:hypothetical protein